MEFTSSAAWFKEKLIPPFDIDRAGGAAFFADAQHKAVVVDGRAVCSLVDPLLERRDGGSYTNITIGKVSLVEAVPSIQLPHKVNWLEFLASLLFWDKKDLVDFRFVRRLFTTALVGTERNDRVHSFRAFLVARYFAMKFRRIAESCDMAYVICYYDAIMLGVVRAFSSAGKSTWDVQHGNLGPTHDAYNNAAAYRLGSRFQPSGFVVWDRSFGAHVESLLGSDWESTDYLHLTALAARSARPGHRQPAILYSLQPETPFPATVETAVEHLKDVQWIFRAHPRQGSLSPDIDRVCRLDNVVFVDASEPLAVTLTRCDLHVTYNSSVVHEAAALNVPSVFLDPAFVDRFAVESARALAYFVPEAALASALEQHIGTIEQSRPCEAPREAS